MKSLRKAFHSGNTQLRQGFTLIHQMKSITSTKEPKYDVCIIGAGPAGLACLSAIREPYSLDHLTEREIDRAHHSMKLHRQLSVCVIDPHLDWLHTWKTSFRQLRIEYLRSPTLAHPDAFDHRALLAHACHKGLDKTELLESGCSDLKELLSLGQTQVGLWKLPSSSLFEEFCDELVGKLPHRRLQGHVVDIEDCGNSLYCIEWKNELDHSNHLKARTVIVATGTSGRSVIPPGLSNCPSFSWKAPDAFPDCVSTPTQQERVLVVGGGLTAVQAALRVVNDGHACVLCSRRPLQEKHFDIPVGWFDLRVANRNLVRIYHDSIDSRLAQIKKVRDGGSVPPWYMKKVREHREMLSCWVGSVEYIEEEQEETRQTVIIRYQGTDHKFDRVILACGVVPDSTVNPILSMLEEKWPIGNHGGFPALTQDLQWGTKHPNLFVVGAMAALEVGPDAGNLMGIRRAANVVASALECRCWLREKALTNPFEALLGDSDSDTEDSSSDQDSL